MEYVYVMLQTYQKEDLFKRIIFFSGRGYAGGAELVISDINIFDILVNILIPKYSERKFPKKYKDDKIQKLSIPKK